MGRILGLPREEQVRQLSSGHVDSLKTDVVQGLGQKRTGALASGKEC